MNPFYDDSGNDFGGRSNNSGSKSGFSWDDLEENNANYYQQQIEQKQNSIIESSNRSIGMMYEAEDVGNETANELLRQGDQLRRTEQKLDKINKDLDTSQRHVTSLSSVFGGIKNYFSRKKNQEAPLEDPPERRGKLHAYVEKTQNPVDEPYDKSKEDQHPALRRRDPTGAGYGQSSQMSAFDTKLDENLDELSSGLARLKGLAQGLGDELEEQNDTIERMTDKSTKVDTKLEKTNKDVKRLLRK